MKFVIAAILFAFVATAQSSVLPWGHFVAGAHFPAAVSVAAAPAALAIGHPGPVQIVAGPAVVAPVAPVVAAPAHGGTFVAKTRGAVHVAPLPGHLASVASVNLQPAPGTW